MAHLINLWFALLGLGSNKLRSALTTLGIIIGVGAVIIIVSLGNGLRRSAEKQMEAFSSGTVEVRPMGGYMMPMPMPEPMSGPVAVEEVKRGAVLGGPIMPMYAQSLDLRDAEALRRLATSVAAVDAQFETGARVVWRGQYLPMGQIVGVTPEFLRVYRREMKVGRFFTEADNEAAAPVVVLDEGLVDMFFGEDVNPVGETLYMTVQSVPQAFTIIGVMGQKEGAMGFGSRSLLVPLRTAQLRLSQGARGTINMIAARVDARASAERRYAVAQINTILRARRGLQPGMPEDFTVHDTLEYSEEMTRVTRTITMVLSLIAGISLIVGSIGLMNIMLVSVSERTWEIGLRRAVGAQQVDILLQFLAEAVLLALVGGAIGLALGAVGSYVVSLLVQSLRGLVWLSLDVVLIAVGVSSAVGVAAGLYPAWRAALLPPTQALRHG
ncbi:MAG: ABC transporter permease [Anaerolineae bacterium]|nr:ABC transporter permease [Anaerolineae bacterium]